MNNKKVIDYKYLPTKLPISHSLLLWLILDKLKSPSWVVGSCWTLMVIIWIACIISTIKEERSSLKDIINGEK